MQTLRRWLRSVTSVKLTANHQLLHHCILGSGLLFLGLVFLLITLDHFLLVVDAYSKWLEVIPVSSLTSQTTILMLRTIFATHGLQEFVVSDNGPSFTSEKFQQFMRWNGVHHVKCTLYHPASNGLAERAVQTFKEGLKKTTQEDIATHLSRFLFQYRLTPHIYYYWDCTSRAPVGMLTLFTSGPIAPKIGLSCPDQAESPET